MSALPTNHCQIRPKIFKRLAEEEGGLAVVVEHDGGQQARRRQQMPDDEDGDEQPGLPDTQVFHARDGRCHAASCCR
jgi:hypothetical protein